MNKLFKLFHIHKYEYFKFGRFPMIAKYCTKCGKLRIGNCIYYDGSIFQKSYYGNDAIKYIKNRRDYLKDNINRIESFNKNMKELGSNKELDLNFLFDYETIEFYDNLINELIKINYE